MADIAPFAGGVIEPRAKTVITKIPNHASCPPGNGMNKSLWKQAENPNGPLDRCRFADRRQFRTGVEIQKRQRMRLFCQELA
jgi:hypothetical protein